MKGFVRLLRRKHAVNAVVRKLLLRLRNFAEKAITYWPVSGIIEVNLAGVDVRLFAAADDLLTSKLYYENNWERNVLPWFAFFSSQASVVVDAGANVGLFSLLAAKAGRTSRIYAFEPNPHNVERLKVNVELNGVSDRVEIVAAALGAESGEIQIHLPANASISGVSSVYKSHSTWFDKTEHKSVAVPLTSLDSFFRYRGEKVDLVKIDVELYEVEVLKGMRRIIERDRPIIFCEIFNDVIRRKLNPALENEIDRGDTEMIASLLSSSGYFFYSITNQGLVEVPHFFFSPMSSMYLLVPIKLRQSHYLYAERHLIESEL